MLGEVIGLLKDQVNAYLGARSGWGTAQPDHGQVDFLKSDRVESPDFKLNGVTLLLVNLEQEHALRPGDPYLRTLADGTSQRVARFTDYQEGLKYISLILQFFQSNRVFDHENAPNLSPAIDRLLVEPVTLPLSEQNMLWGLLRAAYLPSLLYKLRLVVYQDEDGVSLPNSTAPTVAVHS
jgi:hypothetical protein